MKRLVLMTLAILAIGAAAFLIPTLWFKPWSVDHLFARVFVQFAMRRPMMLTELGMLDSMPFDFHGDKLDDMSVEFHKKEAEFLERQIEILEGYDRRSMSPVQRLSTAVGEWFLVDQRDGNRFMFHGYPVNQLSGVQSNLPDFMINTHPLKKPRDARNYVARVSRFGVAIDQVLEGLKLREEMGVIPPRFVLTRVLEELRGFVGRPARENPLYANFEEKTRELSGLDEGKRGELLHNLEREIEETVYPAYGKLIETCERLESVATTDDGVWKLPDGDAYYAYRLRSATTTDLSADSIHALGLREVERIQGEMRRILEARRYPTADLARTLREISREPRFQYSDDDQGRERILADYQSIIEDANQRVGPLFNVRPPTGVEVERIPDFMEATAPAAYYQPPSVGGSRPGRFFVNLRDPQETSRPGMRTLAYHEAIPGHHFQISIMRELEGVPFFRRVILFTAYSEGWGLYAERLALENGFHQDAFDSLGALGAELFRAVRLVVDTGIHRKRWTREQAIDYMVRTTGREESEVVTEVERYVVSPGQACAYKIGQLKILELRQRAMDRLGPRFDIKEFHDVVLTRGAMPLSILEDEVEDWIRSRRDAS